MKALTFILAAILLVGCSPIEGFFMETPEDVYDVPFLTSVSGGFSNARTGNDTVASIIDVDSSGVFYRVYTSTVNSVPDTTRLQTRLAGLNTAWADFPGTGCSTTGAMTFFIERQSTGDTIHVFTYLSDFNTPVRTYATFAPNGTAKSASVNLASINAVSGFQVTNTTRVRRDKDGAWLFFVLRGTTATSVTLYRMAVNYNSWSTLADSYSGLKVSNFPGFKVYDDATFSDFVVRPDGTLWVSVAASGKETQGFAILTSEGSFSRYVGSNSLFNGPLGFDFDDSGNLYVYNSSRRAIEAYTASGTTLVARSQYLAGYGWDQVKQGGWGNGTKTLVTVAGSKVYAFSGPNVDVYTPYKP